MLIDWPAEKAQLMHEIQRAIGRMTLANAPLVMQVAHIVIAEGDRLEFVSPDGTRRSTSLERHEASATFERAEVLRGDGAPIVDAVQKLSSDMAKELDTKMLETMRSAPKEAGSMFSGKTLDEVGEGMVKALEDMDVGFDEDGEPTVALVVHPDTAATLMAQPENPELRRRLDEIMEAKKREWLRRENRRRLVD